MPIIIQPLFYENLHLLRKEEVKLVYKVWELIENIEANLGSPLQGIGKPEALKGNLAGFYSRRINQKHRLIYRFDARVIHLISCYGHYQDK